MKRKFHVRTEEKNLFILDKEVNSSLRFLFGRGIKKITYRVQRYLEDEQNSSQVILEGNYDPDIFARELENSGYKVLCKRELQRKPNQM